MEPVWVSLALGGLWIKIRGLGSWGALSRLVAIVIKPVVDVMAAYLRHKCHMLNGLSLRYFYTHFIEIVYGIFKRRLIWQVIEIDGVNITNYSIIPCSDLFP